MKILFIIPSYKNPLYGGPAVSVSELAEAMAINGHEITVYTTNANGSKELDVRLGVPEIINGVKVYYFKRITGDHTHISPALWKKLYRNAHSFDIIHLHSWWSILILGAAFICYLKRIVYIVSPRGMLGEYTFENKHSKSKLLLHILLGKWLLKKSFLHATSLLEWEECVKINPGWKGFIIHNIIKLPPSNGKISNTKPEVFTIGILSRIDPKKGIELVFEALAKLRFQYRLLIAGSGDENYIQKLKAKASELQIINNIEWCGWVDNEAKFLFFEKVHLSILTSFNENFANSIVESLSKGCPVLVSEKVGLANYVESQKLGWVCKTDPHSISIALTDIFYSPKQLESIHQTAPEKIYKDFDKVKLAEQYSFQYQALLTRIDKIKRNGFFFHNINVQ